MQALTQAQMDSFHYNGFLFPIPRWRRRRSPTASPGWSGWRRNSPRRWRMPTSNGGRTPMRTRRGSTTLIRHPRILDAIEDVIGPDILVWTSTFFIKEPHSPTFAAWHQDGAYFGLEPKEQVCAWVALTDASKEAGCMEICPSRGAPRQLHHAPLGLTNSINRAGQTILEPFDDSAPVAMALRAGEFSLHHELAVHRSAPNNAAHRRVGIGLNYIPTACAREQPGAAEGNAGARRGSPWALRPGRSAGGRTRRGGAGGARRGERSNIVRTTRCKWGV